MNVVHESYQRFAHINKNHILAFKNHTMKIFCIGRNYVDHAKELNNPVPKEPLVFMKPATALLRESNDFYYPGFSKNIHYEVELVLKIIKNGRHIQPAFAKTYYEEVGLGIDFTARDVQQKAKEKGHPWEKAKGFDHSAVISPFFIPLKSLDENIHFSLHKNGEVVQSGYSQDMIFDFNKLICHLSQYFTMQKGDYIYTGTPAGVGPVQIGDKLEGFIGQKSMFKCNIK